MGFFSNIFGSRKPDMSAYNKQIEEAKKQAAKAEEEAERAKKQQRQNQENIAAENKRRRAANSGRFSLLFVDDEDELENLLGK